MKIFEAFCFFFFLSVNYVYAYIYEYKETLMLFSYINLSDMAFM